MEFPDVNGGWTSRPIARLVFLPIAGASTRGARWEPSCPGRHGIVSASFRRLCDFATVGRVKSAPGPAWESAKVFRCELSPGEGFVEHGPQFAGGPAGLSAEQHNTGMSGDQILAPVLP